MSNHVKAEYSKDFHYTFSLLSSNFSNSQYSVPQKMRSSLDKLDTKITQLKS